MTTEELVAAFEGRRELRRDSLRDARTHAFFIGRCLVSELRRPEELGQFGFEEEMKGYFESLSRRELAQRKADFMKRKAAWGDGKLPERLQRLHEIMKYANGDDGTGQAGA